MLQQTGATCECVGLCPRIRYRKVRFTSPIWESPLQLNMGVRLPLGHSIERPLTFTAGLGCETYSLCCLLTAISPSASQGVRKLRASTARRSSVLELLCYAKHSSH